MAKAISGVAVPFLWSFSFFFSLISTPASVVYVVVTWRDSVKGTGRSLVFQRKAVGKNYAGTQETYRSWSLFKGNQQG